MNAIGWIAGGAVAYWFLSRNSEKVEGGVSFTTKSALSTSLLSPLTGGVIASGDFVVSPKQHNASFFNSYVASVDGNYVSLKDVVTNGVVSMDKEKFKSDLTNGSLKVVSNVNIPKVIVNRNEDLLGYGGLYSVEQINNQYALVPMRKPADEYTPKATHAGTYTRNQIWAMLLSGDWRAA